MKNKITKLIKELEFARKKEESSKTLCVYLDWIIDRLNSILMGEKDEGN